MLGAEPDVGVGRQVEDEVGAPHASASAAVIEQVALDQAERPEVRRVLQKPRWPVEKLSKADHLVAARQEPVRPGCCR